jgi:hypothetical protein
LLACFHSCFTVGGNEKRWIQIDRCVGLLWAIQSILKPKDNHPHNPKLLRHILDQLRVIWFLEASMTWIKLLMTFRIRIDTKSKTTTKHLLLSCEGDILLKCVAYCRKLLLPELKLSVIEIVQLTTCNDQFC